MSLLDRIRHCQRRDAARFRRFVAGGAPVGWVGDALAERLRGLPSTFAVEDDSVALIAALDTFDRRSGAVADAVALLRAEGWFPGWRDEAFAVTTSFGAPPLLQIERGAARAFGIRCYCVQLNGLVERADGPLVWIARRALTKPVGPGKLDQIVGGGVPSGASPRQTLLKECAEEASIPAALAGRARPVGAVAYLMQGGDICDDEVLFNYDLVLPADFTPVNADGEVDGFELWPFERLRTVLDDTEDFLFDVALSLIDLLIRRGVVAPNDPHYIDMAEGLWSAPRAAARVEP
jgi:8-oxo-dGTP pyrophosphatase MutT (NUDIX family)